MIDDGNIKFSTFGRAELTGQGKMKARKEKLDQKYGDEKCGESD